MRKIFILGHENPDVDSIISGYLLEKILRIKGYQAEFVIPDKKLDKDTVNICTRNGLNPSKFMKSLNLNNIEDVNYILVDHNTRNLAGKIICIIDHHPIIKEIEIEHYYNNKISSTACYICRGNEHLLDEFDIKLAIIATLVDTASFHSTKGRKEDKDWVINLCNKYNFDYNELAKQGLGTTALDDLHIASLNGLKKYSFDNYSIESSYIQIEDIAIQESKIQKIITILKERIKENELTGFVFIVHDIKVFKTMYYLITENNIYTKHYSRYTQRGDTIIPEIREFLKDNKI